MKNIKIKKKMKNWTKNEKNVNIKSKKKDKKRVEKTSRKKRKRGPKGAPPEMGPKIDFSLENCQEKS